MGARSLRGFFTKIAKKQQYFPNFYANLFAGAERWSAERPLRRDGALGAERSAPILLLERSAGDFKERSGALRITMFCVFPLHLINFCLNAYMTEFKKLIASIIRV